MYIANGLGVILLTHTHTQVVIVVIYPHKSFPGRHFSRESIPTVCNIRWCASISVGRIQRGFVANYRCNVFTALSGVIGVILDDTRREISASC